MNRESDLSSKQILGKKSNFNKKSLAFYKKNPKQNQKKKKAKKKAAHDEQKKAIAYVWHRKLHFNLFEPAKSGISLLKSARVVKHYYPIK